jgi:DNA-binding FrmR family transcriptional regulator
MSTHASHPEIIKRLKRAEGHLKSILSMLEDRPPLPGNRPAAAGR